METILELLEQYGPWVYGLLFLYCGLKSGALPLFAGYAAHAGALDPWIVATATFAGGYLGDEARFALGRRHGAGFMVHRPMVQRALTRAKLLMAHYGAWYIFLYRYPKGMRTIGALPVGLGTMRWSLFTTLNAASAALWTVLLVGGGYVFGDVIATAAQNNWGLVSVLLLFGFIGMGLLAWWRINSLSRIAEAP